MLPEAEIACELATVHAMHDPTEGGIATALVELADAAGVGLRIDRDRIMVLPEGRALCEAFGLDPLGTIASGALLMTLSPADAGIVIHALARESIDCHFIGQVVPREQGIVLKGGHELNLTKTEYRLLCEFADHANMVLSRDQLLERVWGYTFAGDTRTVDVHVRQIRRKLGDASPIVTVWGVGYKVASERSSPAPAA